MPQHRFLALGTGYFRFLAVRFRSCTGCVWVSEPMGKCLCALLVSSRHQRSLIPLAERDQNKYKFTRTVPLADQTRPCWSALCSCCCGAPYYTRMFMPERARQHSSARRSLCSAGVERVRPVPCRAGPRATKLHRKWQTTAGRRQARRGGKMKRRPALQYTARTFSARARAYVVPPNLREDGNPGVSVAPQARKVCCSV